MTPQSNPIPFVVVEITDDLLEPIHSDQTRAPVVLSAEDAADLFDSFQHLVYLTVLISAGSGRRNRRELTDTERRQFELLVESIEIGSFITRFRARRDSQDLWNTADKAIDATVQWLAEVTQKLGESEAISTAVDIAPDVLALVSVVMLPTIQTLAGHPITVEFEQTLAVINAVAGFVKISQRLNRRVVVQKGDREWKPTKADVDNVIRADDALKSQHDRRFDTETREFPTSQGVVTDTDVAARILFIKFPGYDEPVRCQYFQRDGASLRNLRPGDGIEVEGFAMYTRGASMDATPLLISIHDWGRLQHQFPDQYKI